MTVSTANASHGSLPTDQNTFSYAQAAKRISSAPKPHQAADGEPKTPEHGPIDELMTAESNSGSWADDAVRTSSATQAQTQADTNVHHERATLPANVITNNGIDGAKTPSTTSHDADTSVKEETSAPSSVTPSEELSWRRRSISRDGTGDPWGGINLRKSKSKPTQETPATFIEAPPPAVNFWAQRAQEAKNKHVVVTPHHRTSVPGVDTSNVQTEHDANADRETGSVSTQEAAVRASSRQERWASSSRGGRGRNVATVGDATSSRKNSIKQPTSSPASQLPPLQDSQSWPTPKTIQDEQHRRDSGKPNGPTTKAHGKNGWLHVPFTPSVKFETPLPTNARRGGRYSGRGNNRDSIGRDGSYPTSSGSRGPSTAPRDTASHAFAKDGPEATADRTSPLPRKSKSTVVDGEQSVPNRAFSPANVSVSSATPLGEEMELKSPSAGSKPESASHDAKSIMNGPRRNSFKAPELKPRRRGSRVTEHDSTNFRYSDRQRSGSLNSTARPYWPDRRPEYAARPYDSTREPYTSLPYRERGEGRTDRGRPGRARGAFYNSNIPSNIQTNHSSQNYSGMPHSAKSANFNGSFMSSSHSQRGGRGGGNNGTRPGSIPNDTSYGRFQSQYSISPFAQPFVGSSAYDGGAITPTASTAPIAEPYLGHMLWNGVAGQLNYYLSIDNLCKDMYLRRHMDSKGFVSLRLVAQFTRMKNLTTDLELIKRVATTVPDFELYHASSDHVLIRRREGWANFVLAVDQRDPSAQNDGPQLLNVNSTPYARPFGSTDGNSHDSGLSYLQQGQFLSHFSPVATSSPVNGHAGPTNNRYSMPAMIPQIDTTTASHRPSYYAAGGSPQHDRWEDVGEEYDEADSYPDHEIDSQLTILVRTHHDQVPRLQIARSFSNGTIEDVPTTAPDEHRSRSPVQANGSHANDHRGKLAEIKEKLSSPSPVHRPSKSMSQTPPVFWIKNQNETADLPPGAESVPYSSVWANAKQQRSTAPVGECPPDMKVLYGFWSHFLLRNYNRSMYNDFKYFAEDDIGNGSTFGMDHLLDYYDKALFSPDRPVRKIIAQDYVKQVRAEGSQGQGPSFKRLRAAWRNGEMNIKSRKVLQDAMDADLKSSLDR